MKLAKYIAEFMVKNGIEHVFTVTGGGAMHLNDALGHQQGLKSIYNHHTFRKRILRMSRNRRELMRTESCVVCRWSI